MLVGKQAGGPAIAIQHDKFCHAVGWGQCYGLNFVPPKDMLKSSHLVPMPVTLLGNRVFADVTSKGEVLRVGPHPPWLMS